MPNSAQEIRKTKFIKAKAEGKTNIAAGLAAGAPTKEAASKYAQRLSKDVHVQEAINKALLKHGITLEHAIAPIGKALKATKVQITGQGDQAFAEVVEDIELQLKGSDRALKLMGIGKDKDGGGNTYNFTQVINQKASKYAD